MRTPAASVIIANFNGVSYLPDCLNALSCQSFRDFEVVVVDNGSVDDSVELMTRDYPWVTVVRLDGNHGFARANNIGFERSSGAFIATLNNDTIVGERWLEELVIAMDIDPSIGMVASKIFLGREGRRLDSVGMLVYPDGMSRQRGRLETDRGQFDDSPDVLFPSACAALYRRRMLEETGFFDEDFFSYCEDSDLGLRCRLAGWRAVLAPKAEVRHLYSRTGGTYSEFKAYYVERNHKMVLLKNLPLSYIAFSPFYTLLRYGAQFYGIVSGRGSAARFAEGAPRGSLFRLMLRVYRDLIIGLPQCLGKRRAVWRLKKISLKAYRTMLSAARIGVIDLVLTD